MEAMAKKLDGLGQGRRDFSAVPPPVPPAAPADPWSAYKGPAGSPSGSPTASTSQADEINYNHVVVGAFHVDTPRREIECAVGRFLEEWNPQDKAMVVKTMVRGQRARTAHLHLQELPWESAKERFFTLKQLYENKLQTGTAQCWMSANKSAERRARNRTTRRVLGFLQALTQHDIPREDVDWTRQILWLNACRVAACLPDRLRADKMHNIVSRTFEDEYGATGTFYMNVSILARETKLTEDDVVTRLNAC